ncbi:MAG: replicative DNA helicase [Gloeomargarita sp. SKYG116]|nr:replicative DNA helicase [Gloeomargarita sp. SKYG116]MCS7226367.1 replicative DNA helicase [Gloeomargarita sp. SKYB31]MDW8400675.1 replicative DNA helicase [Gloeomargarita sp. SKYGB_i_bin116]
MVSDAPNHPLTSEFNFSPHQLPPQNVAAEEAILGGILLDPEAISRISHLLKPEFFYIQAHQDIYRAALSLHLQGKPTDMTAVASWLQDQGLLEKVGGPAKLVQLVEQVVSAVNIDQYAALVADKYLRRQLIQAGQQILRLGYETAVPIEQVLDQAEQQIFAVCQNQPRQELVSTAEMVSTIWHEIEQRSEDMLPPGITSGFYDLDALTQGFQRSDLIIVAGRPSMGKTSFCLNIARNIAATHRLPVALFSLEMSKEQLVYRLLASEARIESTRLRTGRIAEHEWPQLNQAISTLAQLPIFIDDSASATVMEIRSKCRRLLAEQGNLGLVLIDYLQLMDSGSSGNENRVLELSRMTRGLKTLARELQVPVIVLSQLSRGVEHRTNKRPMLSDLRESGSIEQDADVVIMLYRDEYYHPDTPDRGIAEVIIAKHRNGPTGVAKMLFDAHFTQFRNLKH